MQYGEQCWTMKLWIIRLFVSCSALLDLEKAYEYISLKLIWLLGMVQGMPMSILALSLESFAFPRAVRTGRDLADAVCLRTGWSSSWIKACQ